MPATPGRRAAIYGAEHRRIRRALIHTAVGAPCTRCGEPITDVTDAHLDHDDDDPTKYRGWAHAYCNQRAGAYKGHASRRLGPRTREW